MSAGSTTTGNKSIRTSRRRDKSGSLSLLVFTSGRSPPAFLIRRLWLADIEGRPVCAVDETSQRDPSLKVVRISVTCVMKANII